DEYRIVLAASAEDFNRPLQFVHAADQWIELTPTCPLRKVLAVRRKRIARSRRTFVAQAGCGFVRCGARVAGLRDLRDAVRDEVEDVEAGDAVTVEQPRRFSPRLLEDRRENVAGLHFRFLSALDMQDGRLQHALERRRLLGLPLLPALQVLDALLEMIIQL